MVLMKRHCIGKFFWILAPFTIFFLGSCFMSIEDIAKMSSKEMIEHTTKGVKNARITVGIVQNGQLSFVVYGENGKVLPNREHIYEIGSITKSFTAAMLAKAVNEDRIGLDDSIGLFLNLPTKNYYPTIRRLLTHTSGYDREYYFGYVSTSITNFGNLGNPYYGITKRMVLNRIGRINLENKDYPFEYSNFGYAVAGLVLERIYNEDYRTLMNSYIKNDLVLNNTKISDGSGDLSHYWVWDKGNPYIAVGAITSSITDMMKYAQMQMEETPSYLSLTHSVVAQLNPPVNFPELGIYSDAYGLGWDIDSINNIIMHAGTTNNYNTFLIIDKTNKMAVVVLSNMDGGFRVNAQAIGAAILKELK
jgi:CubicO group peptidase (beta-lactamase class C family)